MKFGAKQQWITRHGHKVYMTRVDDSQGEGSSRAGGEEQKELVFWG